MSTDEPGDEDVDEGVRDRLGDRAEEPDDRLVDLLTWALDTETRARIYVHLREHPNSTSEEISEGADLYPSTVRESLAALHDEGKVGRRKRAAAGAGNNPYEYQAMAPAELVDELVEDVQSELNTVFNLDELLCGERTREESSRGPVSVRIEQGSE